MLINATQTAPERIRQLRAQILVHSCIYYRLNSCVIDDHTWQRRANELRDLQALFGHEIGFYDDEFEGWTGATGYDLPITDGWVVARAQWLIDITDNKV